jgi:trans-2-enoyl-CoA reductase
VRAARYDSHGAPAAVITPVDLADPVPGPGDVLVAVLASPVNPSDLLTIEGRYGALPDLPAIGGSEGVGRIVEGAQAGRMVLLPPGPGMWQARRAVPLADTVPLPDGDPRQLAMLAVNPATASLMLDLGGLAAGDWVIQNAATSALAAYARQLARHRGLRMVDLTRRDDDIPAIRAAGGDVVLADGPGLPKRLAEATGGADIRLGLDGVAGDATRRMANCLGRGALLVNYGAASGEPSAISSRALIVNGVTLRGFWLQATLKAMTADARAALFSELAAQIASGTLHAPVVAAYPLDAIKQAVAHAARARRGGKVLVLPNPA